jgi:hypothetical protein
LFIPLLISLSIYSRDKVIALPIFFIKAIKSATFTAILNFNDYPEEFAAALINEYVIASIKLLLSFICSLISLIPAVEGVT